jgi:hypothetical protein
MVAAMRRLLLCALLAACGDNKERDLPFFEWNGQRTIGAYEVDHLDPTDVHLRDAIDTGQPGNWVVMLYGHIPGVNVSFDTLEAVLVEAQRQHLPTFTFADLVAGTADRPGICLSFDDTEVDTWFALRDLLAKYDAHVTFFVTRYFQFTDDQRAKLHQLYADGNSIEAHGVNHVDSVAYVAANGLQALVDDEVQPSIDILRADGFTPVAYAHPGGGHTRAIDDAILERISLIRSISGAPKD